jgi:hypothetical protein
MGLNLGAAAQRVNQGIRQRKAEDIRLEDILVARALQQQQMELQRQQMEQQAKQFEARLSADRNREGMDQMRFDAGLMRDDEDRQARKDAAAGAGRQLVNASELRRMVSDSPDKAAAAQMYWNETGEHLPQPKPTPEEDLEQYEKRKQIDMKYTRPSAGPAPNYMTLASPDGKQQQRVPDGPQANALLRQGWKLFDPVAARQDGGASGPSPYSAERSQRTIDAVDAAMGDIGAFTTGIGSVLSGVPGTDARKFKGKLTTLKSNIAFNELTQMREASKTGGALGNVANAELELLQNALGALDQGLEGEDLKAQLMQIRDSVNRWRVAQGLPEIQPPDAATAPQTSPGRASGAGPNGGGGVRVLSVRPRGGQ